MSLPAIFAEPRISKLVGRLAQAGLDAVLVTHLPNIGYLSGFTGSSAMMMVTQSEVLLSTDGRYRERAGSEVAAVELDLEELVVGTPAEQLARLLEFVPSGSRVALESEHISWSKASSLVDAELSDHEVVPTSSLVESIRMHKDAAELARMRCASEIASRSLAEAVDRGLVGRSERDIAIEIEQRMVELGASGPSFPSIIAGGENASSPHAIPGDRIVADGDLVVFDLGARVDGYCSDMTRTIPVGKVSDEGLAVLLAVTASQQAGVDALAPGVATSAVDAACRESLGVAGYGEFFVHGTGHGVGLDIHEEPFLGKTTKAILEEGMVITVEPGVYVPGQHGVRVEDMLLITSQGAENLTPHPKA